MTGQPSLRRRRKRVEPLAAHGSFGEIVEMLAQNTGLTKKDARFIAEMFLAVVRDQVWKHRRLFIPGFGVWRVKTWKPRRVRGPVGSNVVEIQLPATDIVRFRAAKNWRHPR